MPIEVTAAIGNVAEIMTPPQGDIDEDEVISEEMERVSETLYGYLLEKVDESEHLKAVAVDKADEQVIAESTDSGTDEADTGETGWLNAEAGAQAVLNVKLAGYGKLETRWRNYLIGSGVVEGVVQGVVAAKLLRNVWIGILVALEEIGQEVLVWGGGEYLFDSFYSPVTLEAELTSTSDSAVVWDDTVFVSIDKDSITKLPEEQQHRKEVQLELTAKKAISELVEDIDKKAGRSLGSHDPRRHNI